MNVAPGSWLRAGGREWQLLQWHFHAPSEHARGGARQAMEAHLVHRDADGEGICWWIKGLGRFS